MSRSSYTPKRVLAIAAVVTSAVAIVVSGTSFAKTRNRPSASTSAASTITLGVPTALSGGGAVIGEGAARGIQMAVAHLNASGGVLGHKLAVDIKDDAGDASTAQQLTKAMIEDQHVSAILGASTTETGSAEAVLANEFKTPLMLWGGNDTSLTAGSNRPYVFQLEPSTYMEPFASAQYLSRLPYKRYYFIAPAYSFGYDTVAAFKKAMTKLGHPIDTVGSQFTQIGTASYGSYISAALAAKPQVIYTLLFGADQINFLKQAQSYGLFSKTKVFAILGTDLETTLKMKTPPGIYLEDRAPFFGVTGGTPSATAFAKQYRAKYGNWPTEWALLGYSSVQMWAEAAKAAGSVSGPAVTAALTKHTFTTIRGKISIRGCDHQALVSDYFWTTGSKPDKFGLPTAESPFISTPKATLPACP